MSLFPTGRGQLLSRKHPLPVEPRAPAAGLQRGCDMFFGSSDIHAKLAALDRSQAVIEFKLDGTIITANKNFVDTLGYSLEEIKGKHHSLFVDAATRDSAEYRQFWQALGRGEYQSAEFKR